jgi:hypothetical protein
VQTLQEIVKDSLQQQVLSGELREKPELLLRKLGLIEFLNGPELEAIQRATTPPVRSQA